MSIEILALRPYLELAYFGAGILLLVGVGITFFQLMLIKRDIRLRNERAAKERAIEATIRYLNNYVPKIDTYSEELREKELVPYAGPLGDFSVESIPPSLLRPAIKRMEPKSVHPALNELEAISAYFTTGVADEQTGFLIIGRTFCFSVEQYYDVITCCRRQKAQPYWYNIVRLYRTWRPRLSKAELRTTIEDLEAQIKLMEAESLASRAD